MNLSTERRKQSRCALQWPLLLWRKDSGQAVEGVTRDISSDGFYCQIQQSFLPGECLECCVEMTSLDQAGNPVFIDLHCQVEVVRASMTIAPPGFGVACRLLSYSILLRQTSLLKTSRYERGAIPSVHL